MIFLITFISNSKKSNPTARKTYDITKLQINWEPPSYASIKQMTIEYNKITFYNNELLSITNTEKSENNTNLPNNNNKTLIGCYNNTEVNTHLKNIIKE